MKLNTHDHTPRSKASKLVTAMFVIWFALLCSMLCVVGFFYAKSVADGILLILISVLPTAFILIPFIDIQKAYVEISDDQIRIVDYYCGIKKEKQIACSEITSAEIHIHYSRQVKGYRLGSPDYRKYIVFKKDNKYLFKIIALPETEKIFEEYLK